jgi:copper chaperone CopZ
METRRFQAPALYGDHHVSEVRRILFQLPGVHDAYASSAFQLIEVTFDPEKISAEQIEASLREVGYLDELPVITEPETASVRADGDGSFRHTAVYEGLKGTISFAQRVEYAGRPLWPCPGMDSGK